MNDTAKPKFKKSFRELLFFFKFLLPYWKTGVGILILLEFSVLLGFVNPYITKLIIDVAYKNRDIKLFITLAVCGGTAFLINGAICAVRDYYSSRVRKKISVDVNERLASHLYSLDLGYFRETSGSENLYKVIYDIERVSYLLINTAEQALKALPTFIFTIVIILFLNWRMGLMAFFMGIFVYIGAVFFGAKRRRLQEEVIIKEQKVFRHLNEGLLNITFLKASGKNIHQTKKYIDKLREAMAAYFKGEKISAMNNFVSGAINKVVIGLIALYGGYQIIKGDMTLGTLSAIVLYLGRITDFHYSLANIYQSVIIGTISCERLFSILNRTIAEPAKPARGKIPLTFGPDIIFDKVNFRYYPDRFVLKNFNMRISPGQWVALAGNSGCGKTTALNLLLGLYYPCAGNIFIEGILTTEVDLNFVRSNCGIALQDTFLWNATIKENITYFDDAPDLKQIERVLEEVKLADLIAALPDGLDTQIGDEACKISAGQKQRLALARALIRRPKFLIMDEALSCVDNKTALEILSALKENYSETALLMVTHSAGALRYADKVVYINDSGSAVTDTHRNLLQAPEYNNVIQED